jgi:hypothetical protein
MRITDRPELVFVGGDGCWLWDQNGTRYLDFVQGWAVNTFGHCPGVVTNALAAQSRTLITPGPGFYNAPALALARRITTHSSFDQVFFTNTGAEANEGAIKLARKWGHKHKGGAYEIDAIVDREHLPPGFGASGAIDPRLGKVENLTPELEKELGGLIAASLNGEHSYGNVALCRTDSGRRRRQCRDRPVPARSARAHARPRPADDRR